MMSSDTPKLSYDLQRHLGRCMKAGSDRILAEPLSDSMTELLERLAAADRVRRPPEGRA